MNRMELVRKGIGMMSGSRCLKTTEFLRKSSEALREGGRIPLRWMEEIAFLRKRSGALRGGGRIPLRRMGEMGLFGAMVAAALAYPPAPHHQIYGIVRTDYGHPVSEEDAQVLFETASGQLIKGYIRSSLPPGQNYRLEIPMDAGLAERRHKPTAMRPEMPFRIRVRIGNQVYLPIEMVAEDGGRIGRPGGKTLINLTLGEDLDGDGLPDAWERSLLQRMTGLDDVDPNADSDGDGLTNLQEYISGNYAYDDEHEFSLEVVGFNGPAPVLEFRAIRGRSYTVYASPDLKTWSPTGFRVAGGENSDSVYDRYYAEDVRDVRIVVPPGDGDGALKYFKLKVQ